MNTIEDRTIVYQAIFINPQDITKLVEMQEDKLPKVIKYMHCTFKYRPSEAEIKKFNELLGKDIELKVVGYCSDGKNSGYEIELSPYQETAYTNSHTVDNENGLPTVERTTPHITVSMQDDAKAVDTGKLSFSREGFEPFTVHGKAGFFTSRMVDKEMLSEIIYEPILEGNEKDAQSSELDLTK